MRLIWTGPAQRDVLAIQKYIAKDNPAAAVKTANRILLAVEGLRQFPHQGRRGKVEETRELVVAKLPYVVVYKVVSEQVMLLRVLHQAQAWPPG